MLRGGIVARVDVQLPDDREREDMRRERGG